MQEYRKVDDLIDELFTMIDESKSGSIFGGKGLDKEEAFNILDDIRYNLPRELKEAKKILDNADKILQDANLEANKIIKMAEEEAQTLVSEHNITRLAQMMEENKRKEMKEYVTEMRDGAINYADSCLLDVEKILQQSLMQINHITKNIEDSLSQELDRIYKNRQEIKMDDLYNN